MQRYFLSKLFLQLLIPICGPSSPFNFLLGIVELPFFDSSAIDLGYHHCLRLASPVAPGAIKQGEGRDDDDNDRYQDTLHFLSQDSKHG